ncbi:unnamed protein product [Prunus brigantina]
MTFYGGSLATLRSLICWMTFFATNSVQWPSLTSSSRCMALQCPYIPCKAQYSLVSLLLGSPFKADFFVAI